MNPFDIRDEPINTGPILGCELPPEGFDPYAPPEPSDEQRALNHQMFMALQAQQEILPSEAVIRIQTQEARITQLLEHVSRLTEVVNNLLSK
jgi:hypothetical protein